MSPATPTLALILRRKPYRDNALLLDAFSREQGRMTGVAQYSRRQADRLKGMLEPFRVLELHWRGRGEVLTLNHAEEKRRYVLKAEALVQATYASELLLRLVPLHQPQPELFRRYLFLLHELQQGENAYTLMLFELQLLSVLGCELNLYQEDATGGDITALMRYRFVTGQGVVPETPDTRSLPGAALPGELLVALRDPLGMTPRQWLQLRQLLDQLLRLYLEGKTVYSRQLLKGP
ncbi:MAG: DNA repair protein RecO [Thiothrix sp.]|nr:DNA repair protein RecO [Thiothrix sp.]